MSRRTPGKQRGRAWKVEPVLKPTPDLHRLTQLLATMAIDRAKQGAPPSRRVKAEMPS